MRFIMAFIRPIREVSNHIFLFIFTAIAGALISYSVNLVIDWSRNTSSVNINGKWLSVSCDRSSKKSEKIAFDVVNIEVTIVGGISISNLQDNKLNEYSYVGSGNVYDGRYFYGKWNSIKEGASTKGSFSFTISPQGDALVGTFTGYDDLGSYTQCWIMGRNSQSLEKGYALAQSQIKIPSETPLVIPNELLQSFRSSK
jgi:hypothetical protein